MIKSLEDPSTFGTNLIVLFPLSRLFYCSLISLALYSANFTRNLKSQKIFVSIFLIISNMVYLQSTGCYISSFLNWPQVGTCTASMNNRCVIVTDWCYLYFSLGISVSLAAGVHHSLIQFHSIVVASNTQCMCVESMNENSKWFCKQLVNGLTQTKGPLKHISLTPAILNIVIS